jgi:hypothetical protein
VTLTAPVPDLEGNTTIAARGARIIAMRPRFDEALVDTTFEVLDTLYRISPAAIIASAAVAVMTLQTTGPEVASTSPGNMFPDGVLVEVWDVSAGVKVTRTVSSHTTTTLTLSSAPGFVVQAGVDFIRLAAQDVVGTGTSTDGYVPANFLSQMPDDEADGTANPVTRWR